MKVMLMPLAMAAMFFRTGMSSQYISVTVITLIGEDRTGHGQRRRTKASALHHPNSHNVKIPTLSLQRTERQGRGSLRSILRNAYSARGLGGFAWPLLVTLALVGLALAGLVSGGTRLTVERKIGCVRPLQIFLFSPSTDKREHHAHNEYQHAKRNQEP